MNDKILNELMNLYARQKNNDELMLAKKIFARWLKKRKLWKEYKDNLIQHGEITFTMSWDQPSRAVDLSGCNDFKYEDVFLPWKEFCHTTLHEHRKHEEL